MTSGEKNPTRAQRLRRRLEKISRNLWWTWDAAGCELWERAAAVLPESRRGLATAPVALLKRISEKQIALLAADRSFTSHVSEVERRLRSATSRCAAPFGLSNSSPVAYFSMEFGLHESLPIYAGGLGILAGDHIKSASDTAVPLVGVTFLYRDGYFRQHLDEKGRQKVIHPKADYSTMPVDIVCDKRGEELRVEVELPGRNVSLRVWQLLVGRRTLYLLDSDVPENRKKDRGITHRLYIGDRESRMSQEVVLGIGGVRVLRALGIKPGVWHLNEGHVVFQSLERLRELTEIAGLDLSAALEVISADTVFTTHTPVPEGNETFDLALAERFLREHCDAAGIPVADYLNLGRDVDADGRPLLSLTVLAMRLSRLRNGVSALHGEVSRDMWSKLWPGFRASESPITSVTNGIHVSTWVAPRYDEIYREYLGADWSQRVHDAAMWKAARKIPDRKLWNAKCELRRQLVDFVRERTRARLERYGYSEARCRRETENLLDPNALTIGFARRFALYKRAGLLFRDLTRAAKIFGSTKRPVQIIFAGKPHPEDPLGAKLFERVGALARKAGLKGRVVLLENYDTEVARYMVRGVDVWLNNPRRPQEASGTSGQKVPVNCGLNLSILDGWWCEGYSKKTGWAFGKEKDYTDHAKQDREDHASLIRVLEREVLPLFYDRDRRGLPKAWMRLVKSSIEALVPRFSTHHMVLEYAERLYASAYENGRLVREGRFALAKELAESTAAVESGWPLVHVRSVTRRGAHLEVEAYLGDIPAGLFAFSDTTGDLLEVERVKRTPEGAHLFVVEAPASGSDVRLFPTHPAMMHVQEFGRSIEV